MLGLMADLSQPNSKAPFQPIHGIGIPLANSLSFEQATGIVAVLLSRLGDPNQAGLTQRQPGRRVPRLWQVCLTLRKLPWPHGNRRHCGHYVATSPPGSAQCSRSTLGLKPPNANARSGVVADPERRSVLISLQSLWISLGNEEAILDGSRQAGHVPKIAQIHAELMSLYRNAMN